MKSLLLLLLSIPLTTTSFFFSNPQLCLLRPPPLFFSKTIFMSKRKQCLSIVYQKETLSPKSPVYATAQVNWGSLIAGGQLVVSELLQQTPTLLVAKASWDNAPTMPPLCIKLKFPLSQHQHEIDMYQRLADASSLFVPIYCAFHQIMPNGEIWGGVCMKFVEDTVGHIMTRNLCMDLIPKDHIMQTRWLHVQQAYACSTTNTQEQEQGGGGIVVEISTAWDVETALFRACVQLLHQLHQKGWVHGDTHLSNFMLDLPTWRVYAIDPERSFPSTDAIQQFLDVQELFGHASGLLLSLQKPTQWDMQDVNAVLSKLHPELSPPSFDTDYFHFLPVCCCFVHEQQKARLQGCRQCNSEFNRQQAARYQTEGPLQWLKNSMDFQSLRSNITRTRTACRAEMQTLAAVLWKHLPALKAAFSAKNDPLLYHILSSSNVDSL
jgi:hypothetical protein